jgi:hypothetical protein
MKELTEQEELNRKRFCLWFYAQPQPFDANKIYKHLLSLLSKDRPCHLGCQVQPCPTCQEMAKRARLYYNTLNPVKE